MVEDSSVASSQFYNVFAQWLATPPPQRVEILDALVKFDDEAVYFHTALSGARNSRIRDL